MKQEIPKVFNQNLWDFHNDHFIIAETNNTKNIVQYWIINKDNDKPELSANQIVEGPFSLAKFTNRKKELKIDSLNFQKDFK